MDGLKQMIANSEVADDVVLRVLKEKLKDHLDKERKVVSPSDEELTLLVELQTLLQNMRPAVYTELEQHMHAQFGYKEFLRYAFWIARKKLSG